MTANTAATPGLVQQKGSTPNMRQDVIGVVEAYLNGLAAKDMSASPFHSNIEFQGPVGPRLIGAATIRAVFSGFFPIVEGVRIIRHIVDGDWCATLFDFETTLGNLPMVHCCHVVDGEIISIHAYYDPRPVLDSGLYFPHLISGQ
jgi:hypothetical protein